MDGKNEIILYQPNDSIQLEVRLENATVWLTQAQMVMLFDRHVSVISRHIRNIFEEGELDEKSNLHFLQIANSDKPITLYNLDVIISVGYRIKSPRGTQFRIWAREIIKEYLLHGYAFNQRFERLEYRMTENEKKIDLVVKTALPPKEGVFYNGQIFDAFVFVADCQNHDFNMILMINLILLFHHNLKNQINPINQGSDNLIDNDIYHVGASFKDLGKKLFAFNKMEMKSSELLKNIV